MSYFTYSFSTKHMIFELAIVPESYVQLLSLFGEAVSLISLSPQCSQWPLSYLETLEGCKDSVISERQRPLCSNLSDT